MKRTEKLYFVCIICVILIFYALPKAPAQNKGNQSSLATDTSLNARIMQSYTGRFDIEFGYGRILTITLEGKQLYVQVTGQPKTPIYPSLPGEFYWKSMDSLDAKVQFIDNGKEAVDKLIFYLDSQKFNAKKMTDEAPVEVDPSILARYIGTYDLAAFKVVFSKEGDNLYSQALVPGGPKILLLPASDYEYFSLESSVHFKFLVEADGKTNSVLVHINGQDIQGRKVKE